MLLPLLRMTTHTLFFVKHPVNYGSAQHQSQKKEAAEGDADALYGGYEQL